MRRTKLTAPKISALSALLLAMMPVAGCSMYTPSQVKTGEIVVADVMKTSTLSAEQFDATDVNVAAKDYMQNGKSGARLVVPYLRKHGSANRAAAMQLGQQYKNAFAKYGIDDLKVDYTETSDREGARHAVLAYTAVVAQAPRDCTRLPGAQGTASLPQIEGYQIGCETRTMLSKMIANPEDLMGNAGTPDGVSRRQGPVTEGYMSGRSNPPLSGLNASTTGTTSVSGGGVSAGQPTTQ
jgi:type IV pilus biogenesis protein CpaD/CtpE